MGRKFVVVFVVVFVTLGLSCTVLSSDFYGGRWEKVSAGLSELETDRSEAVSARIDAHVPLFNRLDESVLEFIYNLDPKTPDDIADAIGGEALRRHKEGIDYVLGSIPFALRKSCDCIDATKDAIYAYKKDAAGAIFSVIALVLSGNYYGNEAAIEVYKSRAQHDADGVVRETYNSIRTCLSSTDADTLAAIKTAENGSATSTHHAINGFFNAMKLIGAAISSGNQRLALISDVKECWAKIYASLRDDIYYVYGLLEALYINSYLKRTGFVSALSVIQYSTIVRSYINGQMVTTVIDEIIYQANRIEIGMSNDGNEVYPRTDAARAKVAGLIVAAFNYFLDSTLFDYPENSGAVSSARKALYGYAEEFACIYLRLIKIALDRSKTFPEILADIDTIKNKEMSVAHKLLENLIAIIRRGETWSDKIESEFKIITDRVVDKAMKYASIVRGGTVILAKVAHANRTIFTDDILAIKSAKSNGVLQIADYTNSLSEAIRFSLLARNQSWS